jgi:two-component system, sensor histidine kinase and response regulator
MFQQPTPPRKHPSSRGDLIIILTASLSLFVVVIATDFFEKIILMLRMYESRELDEIFAFFVGLNVVLVLLLIRRWRALKQEAAQSQETARHLEQERKLLLTLIDHIPDYIFVKDPQGRFVISNLAHSLAAQRSTQELIGKTAFEVFPSELAAQFYADDEAIMRSGRPLLNAERTSIDAFGNERVVLTTKIPLIESDGQVSGLVGISHDITHRKREQEQALELARERERVKMMTGFTKDAAHDFRTPLSVISTSVYLLMRSDDPERRQEHVQRIEDAVARVTHLLDGLTTMTQLDSLNTLALQVTDVNELARAVVSSARKTDHPSSRKLNIELDTTIPLVCGSAYELRQVFMNLIENAMQHTPSSGSITLTTTRQNGEIVIAVRDTGTGINAADLARVFDRFFRTDQARSADTGGIGLGLSIARKIVELHHGRIEAESEPGKGSVFRVWLPVSDKQTPGESCDIITAA